VLAGSQQRGGCQSDQDLDTPANKPGFGDGFSRLESNGARFWGLALRCHGGVLRGVAMEDE